MDFYSNLQQFGQILATSILARSLGWVLITPSIIHTNICKSSSPPLPSSSSTSHIHDRRFTTKHTSCGTPLPTLPLLFLSAPTLLSSLVISGWVDMRRNIRIGPYNNKLKLKIFKYDDDTGLAVIMNISYNQYLVSRPTRLSYFNIPRTEKYQPCSLSSTCFSVQPGSNPGMFSINSADISTITLVSHIAMQ